MKSGNIGVTSENIFPVIKKFLYSDHEIFLRELISNAVDATQKIKALSSMGDFNGELGELTINVVLDEANKTLTIEDKGIGMTADEIEKYINQIAFSGAEEFMQKYSNQAIIGHFGLGFYSAFMVADTVDIITRSYKDGAKTVKWSCDGSPTYTIEEVEDKPTRGSMIVLHLSDDAGEFCNQSKIKELLNKYCRFLPVPIAFGKEQEWKDGKYEDTDKDLIINDVEPLWTKTPSEIKDEDYNEFYHALYPSGEEPLFHIHLNIDYPFNLTGILYFPKIRGNFDMQKNKIQLYSNRVFVTDSVEGIVPEYLTLLHGVIDSPDIPLNVSRSYLQSDSNVKKISSYITRKVAERLNDIFTNQREEFESKWDDIKVFIQYGMLTDEKFAEKAADIVLLKNSDDKYFTFEEYRTLVKENQTDRHGNLIYLYASDPTAQYSFISDAKDKGYDVLIMDGQLDSHFVGWAEQKNSGERFVRVDSDVVEKLIEKDVELTMALSSDQQDKLRPVFEAQLPSNEKVNYTVSFEPMTQSDVPVVITQNEFMRRMKDMAAMGAGGMQFYGQMPDSFNVVVNGNHQLVAEILSDVDSQCSEKLGKIDKKIEAAQNEKSSYADSIKDVKDDELSQEQKDTRDSLETKYTSLVAERRERLMEMGRNNKVVKQIIDLALLSNGMLSGENLRNFIRRSVELIEK
ncbi:MAG: molecular chaperone HtpG [Rikenellaceae bacterium]